MFVSVIVSLSTGNKNRNLTSSHQDHYDLNTAVNPWDIFSRSSLNRLLSFPNVSIKCLDFTIATKRGLTRNDDCYKNTQRDVPGGLNDIGEGGDWHVFKIAPPKKSRQPLAKICWFNWRIVSFWKIYFQRLWDSHAARMNAECWKYGLFIHDYAVKHVMSCELPCDWLTH